MLFLISAMPLVQKVAEEAQKPDPLISIVVAGAVILFGVLALSPLFLGGKKKF